MLYSISEIVKTVKALNGRSSSRGVNKMIRDNQIYFKRLAGKSPTAVLVHTDLNETRILELYKKSNWLGSRPGYKWKKNK